MNSNQAEIMDCLLTPQGSHDPVEEAIEAIEEPSVAFDADMLNVINDILEAVVSKTAASPAADW